jgi:hypothetical protein
MERHPSILKDISKLPAELQSPGVTRIAESEVLENIIFFTQHIHRGHHYFPKQARLFTPTDVIHILASSWPDQEPEITYQRGDGIL